MAEATKGIGQKFRKGYTKDSLIFVSLFSSKKSIEATMEVGANLIVMVNTNTKRF